MISPRNLPTAGDDISVISRGHLPTAGVISARYRRWFADDSADIRGSSVAAGDVMSRWLDGAKADSRHGVNLDVGLDASLASGGYQRCSARQTLTRSMPTAGVSPGARRLGGRPMDVCRTSDGRLLDVHRGTRVGRPLDVSWTSGHHVTRAFYQGRQSGRSRTPCQRPAAFIGSANSAIASSRSTQSQN